MINKSQRREVVKTAYTVMKYVLVLSYLCYANLVVA